MQSNPADDGAEWVELFLKSNRNGLQLLALPSVTKDFVWVEDQPDWIRPVFAAFVGVDPFGGGLDPATNILLTGGGSMSVGFRRPEFDMDFDMRSYLTWPLIIANPVADLLGGLDPATISRP